MNERSPWVIALHMLFSGMSPIVPEIKVRMTTKARSSLAQHRNRL